MDMYVIFSAMASLNGKEKHQCNYVLSSMQAMLNCVFLSLSPLSPPVLSWMKLHLCQVDNVLVKLFCNFLDLF